MMHLTLSSHYHFSETDYILDGLCIGGVKTGDEFYETYDLGKNIGFGRYSRVHIAKSRSTGNLYACKIVDKLALSSASKVRDEITILTSLQHQCIASLHDYFENEKEIFLVLDLATGGELFYRLQEKKRYKESEASEVIRSLIDACVYMHELNIVHRDIKLENILLVSPKSDTEIMLTDFGLAKMLDSGPSETSMVGSKRRSDDVRLRKSTSYCEKRRRRAYSTCGTDYYVSPEILKGQGYCETVDMWSVGVVMYMLLLGRPPFSNDGASLYENIKAGKFYKPGVHWETISTEAKDLLTRLLAVDPEKRITASEAANHAWFKASDVQ